MERSSYFGRVASRWHSTASARLLCCSVLLLGFSLFVFLCVSVSKVGDSGYHAVRAFRPSHRWEQQVRQSCLPKRDENAMVVLVTGAAGFVGSHVSLALKKRGDGVVGLDNFNTYYEISLKRARQDLLEKHGVYVVEGDINDQLLLKTLFDLVQVTHVMHLAAQAGVRYAMQNPGSYIHSNIAGLVNIFENCKTANPQPSIVWASSSSVYGLNTKVRAKPSLAVRHRGNGPSLTESCLSLSQVSSALTDVYDLHIAPKFSSIHFNASRNTIQDHPPFRFSIISSTVTSFSDIAYSFEPKILFPTCYFFWWCRCLSRNLIEQISQQVCMRQQRKLERKLPILTTTSTVFPSPDFDFSPCMGHGVDLIWLTFPSPATSLRGSPLAFIRVMVVKIWRVISLSSMILLRDVLPL